jgi:hypothetical protein
LQFAGPYRSAAGQMCSHLQRIEESVPPHAYACSSGIGPIRTPACQTEREEEEGADHCELAMHRAQGTAGIPRPIQRRAASAPLFGCS